MGLLRQLEALQDALWRHAVVSLPLNTPGITECGLRSVPDMVRFQPGVVRHDSIEAGENRGQGSIATMPLSGPSSGHRNRRTAKLKVPHTWRTRSDPFESVWGEITRWLTECPEITAKSVLCQLQHLYPRQFLDSQLRTLQRRVKEWRARVLLQFDDRWLNEEIMVGQTLPRPLRASVEENGEAVLASAVKDGF